MPIIVLRREARLDLDQIDGFSRQRFGNERADIYMSDLLAAFDRLIEFPELGSYIPSRNARSYPVGRHRIVYNFDGKRVVIIRVLHQAMNMNIHLEG